VLKQMDLILHVIGSRRWQKLNDPSVIYNACPALNVNKILQNMRVKLLHLSTLPITEFYKLSVDLSIWPWVTQHTRIRKCFVGNTPCSVTKHV
jgi:hypothetical protein